MTESLEWEHHFIDANGLNFHCVTQGEGELVLLLHGFPEFWYSWRHQIPFLAQSFRVVAPDLRGYGETDKPPLVSDYSLGKLTNDVKGIIEAFGADRAHVVAHDWGGVIAWMFAATYPQMLDRLVVLNAPHPALFLDQITHNPGQILRSWYMFFFQLPLLPEAVLKARGCSLVKHLFSDWAVDKSAFSETDLEKLARAAARPGALTGGINYYRSMMRNFKLLGASKDFPPITRPTMLIWAEKDRALGKQLTYGLERYFDDEFKVRYVPNCSHWVQQEQPNVVNMHLGDFL